MCWAWSASCATPVGVRRRVLDAADREPAERDREERQQQHPEPEVRHRVRRHRERRRRVVRLRAAPPRGGDADQDRRRRPRAPSRRRRARSSPAPCRRSRTITGWLVTYERPKLRLAVCCEVAPELLELSSRRARTRASAPRAATAVRLRPRNRFATGSLATTRNRKKLNTTTKARVASDPSTFVMTNLALTRARRRCGGAIAHQTARRRRAATDRDDRDDQPAPPMPPSSPPPASAAPVGVADAGLRVA